MLLRIFLPLTFMIISIECTQIPFIRNAIFVAASNATSITIQNTTCIQCLCNASSSDLILNCLPNNTCQYFLNFPRTYSIQTLTNARIYFPQGVFPNASRCCMPNLTDIINKVLSAIPIYGQVFSPRCVALDNHGYVVTISQTNNSLVRFNSTTMALIDNTLGLFSGPTNLKYYNGNYYVGLASSVVVINSNTLTVSNSISSSNLSQTRDMMFLNNGDEFVVVSTGNNRFVFFNRSSNTSTNYYAFYQQSVNYANPHGLVYINDSFFYATSWAANTVYSYTSIPNSYSWNQTLIINATRWASSSNGNHIAIDECGRFWYSLGPYGLEVFDSQGTFLTNMSLPSLSIFDAIITDNYVFYISDTGTNRIIRIDPNIQC